MWSQKVGDYAKTNFQYQTIYNKQQARALADEYKILYMHKIWEWTNVIWDCLSKTFFNSATKTKHKLKKKM